MDTDAHELENELNPMLRCFHAGTNETGAPLMWRLREPGHAAGVDDDGEGFIDFEDLGFHGDGSGEGEAHVVGP